MLHLPSQATAGLLASDLVVVKNKFYGQNLESQIGADLIIPFNPLSLHHPTTVFTYKCNSQMLNKNTKQSWDTYLQTFDHGKTGSKTYRANLIDKAPIKNYGQLLIIGTKYKSSNPDGFPEGDDFEFLYNLADELIELIEQSTNSILVGSFLYNGERLEYFYIQYPDNLIGKIENFYKSNYPDRQFFITIKEDKQWKYYKEFLFPSKQEAENLQSVG